ncbi:MAG TPA: multidrug transporter, partial [Desulfurococcales archaeon]|nr:multidrug transporter [Desulfurococcales archaeon]
HEELSTLAPLIALSYLWATLFGIIVLGEQATVTKLLGLFLIVVGAALVISKP